MKKLLSVILMMLAGAAFALPSQAQLLKVVVADKALQAQTSIPWQKALQFDSKGVAILENPEITGRKELLVELEERKEFFNAIVEPGQTLTITITLKDDKTEASYTGKYAEECKYKNADMHFYPSTYIPVKPEKPIDFAAAKAMLEDVLSAASASAQQTCKVVGNVKDIADGKTLLLMVERSEQVIDSTTIKDGKFEFVIPINDTTTQYPLIVSYPESSPLPVQVQLYAEPGAVLKATLSNDLENNHVVGSPLNFIYKVFTEKYMAVMKKAIALRTASLDESLSEEERAEKTRLANAEQNKIIELEQEFAEQNIDNIIGINLLAQRAVLFDKKEVARIMKDVPAKWDNHPDVIQLRKDLMVEAKTAEGESYIDLTMPDPKGKSMSLSQCIKKNKLTLVDFWASWCGPCRALIPGVKRLYAKYKKQGFGVVGVSLDSKKETWLKALKELDMPWPQMSDVKGWDSEAAKAYNIKGIPFTLLVAKDGTIVGRNIWGEQALEERIVKFLGEQK
ncbi:MAG: AhpC/TSA family protein [Prevotella sp.]|nr:AhpC/TSA family protein [Prevotella sp.]